MLVGCGCLLPFQMVSHIHHCKPNALCFQRSKPLIKHIHTPLRTILSTKPDGTPPLQITDYNPVCVSFTNRYLVNTNHLGVVPWGARRSCSCIYCLSSSLTVFQSSRNSLATSLMVELRQRSPIYIAKRLV